MTLKTSQQLFLKSQASLNRANYAIFQGKLVKKRSFCHNYPNAETHSKDAAGLQSPMD
jgi:hypothetical protein